MEAELAKAMVLSGEKVTAGEAWSHTHTEGSRIPRILASIQETVCYESNQIMYTHAALVEGGTT